MNMLDRRKFIALAGAAAAVLGLPREGVAQQDPMSMYWRVRELVELLRNYSAIPNTTPLTTQEEQQAALEALYAGIGGITTNFYSVVIEAGYMAHYLWQLRSNSVYEGIDQEPEVIAFDAYLYAHVHVLIHAAHMTSTLGLADPIEIVEEIEVAR